MNKRATQQFIDKYTKLAVVNHLMGLLTADKTEGQLFVLGQLALVSIHDRQRYYRIYEIQTAVCAGDLAQVRLLISNNWKSTLEK
ncbi:hypothetical protein [Paenibacillus qinlingensis]|uniref:hypothetical protein n=1 Tax=Paenibacillus qinlingensis TaxID=1837343 RepID=UPI0015659225|nr:hypothetical protein [Paenibacillus qinlingensis]NQX59943.1 hypothetical protein [Paenibacillus qinlingensis]